VEPVRTCVGCRNRVAKSDLLRVVVVEGSLVPDPRGNLPGRGAHLHPDPQCLASAERRRAFGRALRLDRPPDAAALADYVAQRADS
jgi:predicted RNA-binding protein YlxR (DUF448 family)